MPYRPDNHIVADLAVNAVANICNKCGWACEVVKQDYGEDLLVQPSFGTVVDDNRIWIQVKGTRNIERLRSKSYGISISVSANQALRWARSAELVAVVLWDVEKELGWWSLPKDGVNQWNLVAIQRGQSRLLFKDDCTFNKEAALLLGWQARLGHYANLIAKCFEEDYQDALERAEEAKHERNHRSIVPLITFDFLKRMRVLDNNFFTLEFLTQLYESKCIINDLSGDQPYNDGQVLLIGLLRHIAVLSNNCPIPRRLLQSCYEFAEFFMNHLEVKIPEICDVCGDD